MPHPLPSPSPGESIACQLKESEKSFTGRISKGKRILMLKFSKFKLLSPPFEGGVAAVQ